jgi:hypothetical protein
MKPPYDGSEEQLILFLLKLDIRHAFKEESILNFAYKVLG